MQDTEPVQSHIVPDRRELRRQAGDVNNDGILSEQEIFAVLENGQVNIADGVIQALTREELVAYVIQRQSGGDDTRLQRETHAHLQADMNVFIQQVREIPQPDMLEHYLQVLERIDIPTDIARLAKDIVGDVVVVVPQGPVAQMHGKSRARI